MTAFGWWLRMAKAVVVKTWINITTGQTCLFVCLFYVETCPLLCREVTIIVEVQL